MDKKTIMIALGGNSLSPKGSSGTVGEQFSFTRRTMDHLSEFILKDYNICITHGNGPQVGNDYRMDLTNDVIPPPLGICVAILKGRSDIWSSKHSKIN